MPIGSMQFRKYIGKYQERNFLFRDKPIKSLHFTDTTRLSEFVKTAGNSFLTSEVSTNWKAKDFLNISLENKNAVKTSLLLLLFLSQINISTASQRTDENLTMKNSSYDIQLISWLDEIYNISTNKSNELMNRLVDFNIFRFPMATALMLNERSPNFQPIDNVRHHKTKALHNRVLSQITKKLHRFLKKQGILQIENITKEELIFHSLEYSLLDSKNVKNIARKILSVYQSYDRREEKSLSIRQSEEIVRNWIFTTIWDTSLTGYVVKSIAKDSHRLQYTIDDIVDLLSFERLEKEDTINLNKLQEEDRLRFKDLWNSLVENELAFIHFYNIDRNLGKILLGSLEFADLYTGARYLSEFISLDCCTSSEVLELGKKMWGNAAEKGISITTQPYFLTPALFFEAQSAPQVVSEVKNLTDITETAIIDQITYRSLAQQINKSIVLKLSFFKDSFEKWNAMSQEEKDIHNEEYKELIGKMKDYFSELDEYLLVAGLNSASNDEKNFIFSPNGIVSPITVRKKRKNISMTITPFYGMQCYNKNFKPVYCKNYIDETVQLHKTDLFSIRRENEERIYALQNGDNGYKIFRLDRDIQRYLRLEIFSSEEIRNGELINKNEIKIKNKLFNFEFKSDKNFSQKKDSVTELVNFFRNRHSDELYTFLYELGNHPSTLEKIGDALRHFIPLHDCIEGILSDNKKEAAFSCFLDALIIFPALEGSLTMIEKLGLYVAKELRSTGLSLPKNSYSFVSSGNALLKEIDLPAMNNLRTMQKSIYTNLNSGFQVLGAISKKYTDRIINILSNDKKTVPLAEKIRNIDLEKKTVDSFDSYIIARLPHSEIRVPIRKVGERDGKEIYSVFNPRTSETAWGRFELQENNQLVLMEASPLSISKALAKSITENMYVKEIDVHSLSEPDYMGLRWDFQHTNGYLNYKNNWLKIKILKDQFFLVSEKGILPLLIKNYELIPEGLFDRILRLQKQGFAGTQLTVKEIIANKLNISDKEATELLYKYKFPDTSQYYTKETFALWIEKTGQIPSWAESFKILDRDTYLSRFNTGELQSSGLYSFSGGEGFVYRVDKTPPDIVLHSGFNPTEDYGALEKMIPAEEEGLTAAGDLKGVLRYNEWVKSPYIYAIKIEDIRGVSLQENLMKNPHNLKEFLGESREETYTTIESLAEDSNGAIYLDEIHLYNRDVKPEYISLVTKEEIEAEMPLSEGPWQNYL